MIAIELPPSRHATATQAGLAFIADFLEACGLIALSGLFMGHVTANIAVLGLGLATELCVRAVVGWGQPPRSTPDQEQGRGEAASRVRRHDALVHGSSQEPGLSCSLEHQTTRTEIGKPSPAIRTRMLHPIFASVC